MDPSPMKNAATDQRPNTSRMPSRPLEFWGTMICGKMPAGCRFLPGCCRCSALPRVWLEIEDDDSMLARFSDHGGLFLVLSRGFKAVVEDRVKRRRWFDPNKISLKLDGHQNREGVFDRDLDLAPKRQYGLCVGAV